jgi:DNA-binding FadR family transcriptional regulator
MHQPIVDAVIKGEPDVAYNAMKKHAIEFGEILVSLEQTYQTKKLSPGS